MNPNNNPMSRCYQSSTSITQAPPGPGTQMPFMFGGSTGFGTTTPMTNQIPRAVQSQTNMNFSNSVRDCMFWPGSLGNGQPQPARGGGGFGGRSNVGRSGGRAVMNNMGGGRPAMSMGMNMGGMGGMGAGPMRPRMTMQTAPMSNSNDGQAGAYILSGNGQGEARKGMSLPFQLAPAGAQLGPLANMEPITVKLTAPPGAGAGGQPISFQISPNQLWGGQ